MSENSAFWEDEITGDAASITGWEAPYTSSEKVDILSKLIGSDDIVGYILPEHSEELSVVATTPSSMDILVLSGSAFIKGRIYENTATEDFTISANASGNPRIDRVILRVDFAAQTIRLAILEGTPGANPALPTLTQDANEREVSLAYIWVENGATSIPNTEIHDEREFLLSFEAVNNAYTPVNHIENSELMASKNSVPVTPLYWVELDGSQQTWILEDKPTLMSRGLAYKVTSTNTDASSSRGIRQTFLIKPNTEYAIKALIKVDAGVVATFNITTDSFSPNTLSRDIRISESWVEETIYYKSEHDAYNMTITITLPAVNNNAIYLGQVLVIEGYYAGNFRQFSEFLLGQSILVISDSYSSETVVINTLPEIPSGTKSVLVLMSIIEETVYGMGSVENFGAVIRAKDGTEPLLVCHGFPSTSAAFYRWGNVLGEVPLIDNEFEIDFTASDVDSLSGYTTVYGIRT